MTFKDAEREFLHHYRAMNAVGLAFERTWVYSEPAPAVYERDFPDRGKLIRRSVEGFEIRVGRASWGVGVTLRIVPFRSVHPYGHSDIQSGDLTVDELQLLMAARRVVDQWIAGEIDELPTDPPR